VVRERENHPSILGQFKVIVMFTKTIVILPKILLTSGQVSLTTLSMQRAIDEHRIF